MSESILPLPKERQGVSPIIGTILMIGIVVMAMTIFSYYALQTPSLERYVAFEVKVEATDNVENVKIILTHAGGETIITPAKYLKVWGVEVDNVFAIGTDNVGYETAVDNLSRFAEYKMGDSATLYVHHDDANVVAGDKYRITIYDNYTEKVIYEQILVVETKPTA